MDKINCVLCKEKSTASCILSSEDLESLSNNNTQVQFRKGDIIFRQGTLSTDIKYLKEGLAKIHKTGPSKEKIINLVKGPSYIGLSTTLADKINRYSVTALEKCTVCFISNETFKNFIIRNGKFAWEIILDICKKELEDAERFVDQFQKQVPGRLASTLLCMANKIFMNDSFELPLTRAELADLNGTSRESVCRILSDFDNDGLIQLEGKKMTILKADLLCEISEKG